MKHLLFYAAAVIAVIAAAVFVWARFLSRKPTSPDYEYGRARGPQSGFMDTSEARSGVTPIKGNLETVAISKSFANPWFGKTVTLTSSMPTGNPVRVQTKTIW